MQQDGNEDGGEEQPEVGQEEQDASESQVRRCSD